jgi:hypothetical protein
LVIQRGLPESEAKAVPNVRSRDVGNGYHWYQLPTAEISGQVVMLSLCFFKNALEFVTVEVADDDQPGDPWSNWSAEREQARAEAIRQWLANIGCPVGDYTWGSVSAEVDAKSGGASGGVRFR